MKAACLMMEHSQLNNGVELALLLLKHFEETNADPLDEKNIGNVISLPPNSKVSC